MFIVHGKIRPVGSAVFTLVTPKSWNSLFHSLISLVKMQLNYLQLKLFTQLHLVPITAGWTEAVWIHNFHKAFAHDRRCGNRTPQTPRPLDHAPNALITRPRFPHYSITYKLEQSFTDIRIFKSSNGVVRVMLEKQNNILLKNNI